MSDPLELLAAAGRPRPLPPDVRARLEAALTGRPAVPSSGTDVEAPSRGRVAAPSPAHLETVLAGLDAPRPLADAQRARLEGALARARGPWRRSDTVQRALAAAAAVTLLAASGTLLVRVRGTGREPAALAPPTPPATTSPLASGGRVGAALGAVAPLRTFDGCGPLLSHVRERARPLVGPYGLPGSVGSVPEGVGGIEAPGAQTGPAQAPLAAASGPAPFSQTNVQEAGIDEPDLVKNDGDRILAIARGALHYVSIREGAPRLAGTLALPPGWGHELFLVGDRAIVTALTEERLAPQMPDRWGAQDRTVISVVDVSAPGSMRVLSNLYTEGTFVSARLAEGVARVVVRSQPGPFSFTFPSGSTRRAERTALARNRRMVALSTLDHWLPNFLLEDRRGTAPRLSSGRLVDCAEVHYPAAFSGIGMVTLLTVDPADPARRESVSVLADAQTVYASAGSLYVATTRWLDTAVRPAPGGDRVTTEIHKFDISERERAYYQASGSVPGSLLNQWSLSEHEGVLRVATTLGVAGGLESSESVVTALAERVGVLVPIGRVGDLGRGERIFGVRFMGDVGFVVTFRQTDPLYTLDLSDPRRPQVKGELKIPGYSAYLHPVGKGLLLGVGQDATQSGQVRGTQLSLFDVSDLSSPKRLHHTALPGARSEVEQDHRAFLWWSARRLAVLPVQTWDSTPFVGAVGFRVEAAEGIEEVGRVAHPGTEALHQDPWKATIRRSIVIGDVLFTVSERGLMASDLSRLRERSWLAWPSRFTSVETYAGSVRGADDGDRWSARFSRPGQIAEDAAGNLFVADQGNRRVRRIDREARVRTVTFRVGPDGSGDRRADFPGAVTGLAVTPGGTLWVATGCALWRVTDAKSADAVATQVAGAPFPEAGCTDGTKNPSEAADGIGIAARFGRTGHVAIARDGAVVVADTGAHAIRLVRLDEHGLATVETIAGRLGRAGHADGEGTGALFRGPSGLAVLPDGDVLIADTGNHVLRRFDVATRRVSTVAGAPGRSGAGRLTSPVGVAYDRRTRTIFATEWEASGPGGSRVRAINRGRISTVAGTGQPGFADGPVSVARFSSPSGVLVLRDGSLIVSDTLNHRLRFVRLE